MTLRIHGTDEQIRTRFPAGLATLSEHEVAPTHEDAPTHERAPGRDPADARWLRVELRAERLDWLPPLLASLDRPFVIERPAELRDLVAALADRLASCAREG